MKTRLLTLLLAITLAFNVNCLQTEATSLEILTEEKPAAEEVIDISKNVTFEDLQLYRNVYDDISYEKTICGPPEAPSVDVPEMVNLGKFRITYYCGCDSCSEGWGDMTATGVRAKEGRTIAVDPSVIPYGTHVIINGHEYIAEDCGGAIKGNDIDIYLNHHNKVYESGVDWYEVWILKD